MGELYHGAHTMKNGHPIVLHHRVPTIKRMMIPGMDTNKDALMSPDAPRKFSILDSRNIGNI